MVNLNGTEWLFLAIWICSTQLLLQAAPLAGEKKNSKKESPIEDELLSLQNQLPASPKEQNLASREVINPPNLVEVAKTNVNIEAPLKVANKPSGTVKITGYQQVFESPAIDLTPQAVAEYLVLTGDFDGLDMALLDLVRSKILSLYEVEQYKEAVGLEYERMLQQIIDAEESYIQALNLLYGDMPGMKDTPPVELPQEVQQQQQQPLPQQPVPQPEQQQQLQPIAETVIEVGKLTAIQDPSNPASGVLPMEKYVQSVAEKATENAKTKENNEFDKVIEWISSEMEKQLQKAKEAALVSEIKKEEMSGINEAQLPVQEVVPVQEVIPVQEVVPQKVSPNLDVKTDEGQLDDLENRDNQGKMVIKEEKPEQQSE